MLRVSMAYIVEVEFGDILPRPAMGLSVTPIASAQFTGGPSDEPSMVLNPIERLAVELLSWRGFGGGVILLPKTKR